MIITLQFHEIAYLIYFIKKKSNDTLTPKLFDPPGKDGGFPAREAATLP